MLGYLKAHKESQAEAIKESYKAASIQKEVSQKVNAETSTAIANIKDLQALVIDAAQRFGLDATSDAYTSKWNPAAETPYSYTRNHQREQVAKSRELVSKNDYGAGFSRLVTQNVIGEKGIRFQCVSTKANGDLNTEANDAIEASWKEWGRAENCDITGNQSLIEIQETLIKSLVTDGEFFVRKIVDGNDIKLQLLDSQRCNPQRTLKYGTTEDQIELNGIVVDKETRKPLHYLFSDDVRFHLGGSYYSENDDVEAIPANEIIHGFITEGIGQMRGFPLIKTAIQRLYSLDKYEESALINARVTANKLGFFVNTTGDDNNANINADTKISGKAGSFESLPPGYTLASWNPDYPHGEFPSFLKAMLRAVSSSMGVNYNTLANDLEGVNYSSMRSGSISERDYWKILQQRFIEKFMDKVYREWLPLQLRAGKIRAGGRRLKLSNLNKYFMVSWTPRRWQWVDPRNEMDANIAGIRGFLIAPSDIIRQQGEDPHEVYRQIATDIEMMKDEGIPETFIESFFIGKTAAAESIEAESENPNPESDDSEPADDSDNPNEIVGSPTDDMPQGA